MFNVGLHRFANVRRHTVRTMCHIWHNIALWHCTPHTEDACNEDRSPAIGVQRHIKKQRGRQHHALVLPCETGAEQGVCASSQDEDSQESLSQLLKHGLGRATVAAELLCLCSMMPFLYIEASTLLEYGFYGWGSIWNFMDIVAYVNQVHNKLELHWSKSDSLPLEGSALCMSHLEVFLGSVHERHLVHVNLASEPTKPCQ